MADTEVAMASKQITKKQQPRQRLVSEQKWVSVWNPNEKLRPYIEISFNTADIPHRIRSKLHSLGVAGSCARLHFFKAVAEGRCF